MTDLVQLIQESDLALVAMEQSRQAVEAAKAVLEIAKTEADEAKAAFDQVIARADEFGIARVKLRKLAEERAAVLMASGLISMPVNQVRAPKSPKENGRPGKRAKVDKSADDDVALTDMGRVDQTSDEGNILRLDA